MSKLAAKNLYVLGAIVVVVALILVVTLNKNKTSPSTSQDTAASQQLAGKVVCAPKKSTGPSTLECAYGLETSDGKNYLINTAKFPEGTNTQQYPTGTSIIVTGELSSPAQELQMYDIEAVIAATKIQQQ